MTSIVQQVALFQQGASIEEHTRAVLAEAREINEHYNYFTTLCEKEAMARAQFLDRLSAQEKASLSLLGVPLTVKDALCVKGVESTAGSRILKGYRPPFNATAVQKCIDAGAVVIGKTSQDEFGFGGFSVNVGLGFQVPKNPFDPDVSTGGSSGGCAGFTQKTSFPHLSLAESTGGSIVEPASFCGVVGLCPTYGRVSRYGLIDYANTLDKIGPMAKTVDETALLMDTIAGPDEKDGTTLREPCAVQPAITKGVKGLRIGVVKEAFGDATDSIVAETVWQCIHVLEAAGARYEECSLPLTGAYGVPTYYILATCEASTNLAKLCGLRYGMQEELSGTFNDYFTNVRSNNFGAEAKRRIMLGTFARMVGFRDAFYIKALKARQLITNEYLSLFKKYDVLITPTAPILPPSFAHLKKLTPLQHYMLDILTVGPNLAGLPHLNVPVGMHNGLPVGALLMGTHCAESTLVQAGACLEKNSKNEKK